MSEDLTNVNHEPCHPLSVFQAPALEVMGFLARQGVAWEVEYDDVYWDLNHTLRVLHLRHADVCTPLRDLLLPLLGTPPRAFVSSFDLLTWLLWASPLPLCQDFVTWLWQTYLPRLATADVPSPDAPGGPLPRPAGQGCQQGA